MKTRPNPVFTADELAAWRKSLDPADSVAVIAGSFHMFQPGNLAAIRLARQLATSLCMVVEPDRSDDAADRPSISLDERTEMVSHLRDADCVTSFSPGDAATCLAALKPYKWVCCDGQADGPLGRRAAELADGRISVPAVAGCFTNDILRSIREKRTPIILPDAFPDRGGDRETGARGFPVTVNGCFDVLHIGHLRFLARAAEMGDGLTVLINDDSSVRRYKGPTRPVFPSKFRAAALLALRSVSAVRTFAEDNPLRLIAELRPALHVKGGTYEPDRVDTERGLLAGWGGKMAFCPMVEGRSTTGYLNRVTER